METMRTTRHIWQSMWDTFKEHNGVGQHKGKQLRTSWGTRSVTQWKKISVINIGILMQTKNWALMLPIMQIILCILLFM
jgi:hypothetical protein